MMSERNWGSEAEVSGRGRRAERPFKWSARAELAAVLSAHDLKTAEAIAAAAGVAVATLRRWRGHPAFRARVEEHVAAFAEITRQSGLAMVEDRVAALEERWQGLRRIIRRRAEVMNTLDEQVPGAATGLLTRQTKISGIGPKAQVVEEYVLDAVLLRELREHEKQAAQELGQWAERKELRGKDGGPVKVEVVYVNDWRSLPTFDE